MGNSPLLTFAYSLHFEVIYVSFTFLQCHSYPSGKNRRKTVCRVYFWQHVLYFWCRINKTFLHVSTWYSLV